MDKSVEQKLKEIIANQKTITAVALELKVSRQTVYKWLSRYKRDSTEAASALRNRKSQSAHNRIPSQVENLVIEVAMKNPEDSVSTLATKLEATYKVVINSATVFRILKRNKVRYAVVPRTKKAASYVPPTVIPAPVPVSENLSSLPETVEVAPVTAPEILPVSSPESVVASPSPYVASPVFLALRKKIFFLAVVAFMGVVSVYGMHRISTGAIALREGGYIGAVPAHKLATPNFARYQNIMRGGLIAHRADILRVVKLTPKTFTTSSLATSLSSLMKGGSRIAALDFIPTETYQGYALGGYKVSAADATASLSNKSNIAILDRISLSLFCGIASFSSTIQESRCNYDAIASGVAATSSVAVLGFPVEKIPEPIVVVATTTATTSLAAARDVTPAPRITQYITKYVTEYIPVEGPAGKDGKDGRNGNDGITLFDATRTYPGYGSYIVPPSTNNSPSAPIGISTIAYLKDTRIESPTIVGGSAIGFNLNTSSFVDPMFSGLATFNGAALFTGDVTINSLTASSSVLANASTTNAYVTALFADAATSTDSYIARLVAASSTLTDAMLTNSTTTNAYIASLISASSTIGNLIATNATTTDLSTINFTAGTSTTGLLFVTGTSTLATTTITKAMIVNASTTNFSAVDAVMTNATTTNFFTTLLNATTGFFINLTSTNATTTNLVATNATSTNFFTSLLNVTTGFFTNLTATNATTTNLVATNATTTNLFSNLLSAVTGFFTTITSTGTSTFATAGGNVGIGTTTPGSLLSVQGNAYFGGNVTATGTLSVTGQTTLGNASTTALSALNATFTNGTSTNFFTQNLAVGNASTTGSQSIDGTLTVNGTTTIGSNTILQGSVALGTSTSNYITVNGLINSSIVPAANITYDVGSPSFYWKTMYVDTINANTISSASLAINGVSTNSFTINTDNVTNDEEDSSLVFFRGMITPNAVLRWNTGTKRLESNMSFKVQNETPVTGTTTFTVQGGAGQGSTNLFELVNNGGTKLSVFDAAGSLGIGTTTPSQKLEVTGNASFSAGTSATGGIYIGPVGYQASIFYNTNGNLDLTPRAGYSTVFTAGNVGIGTANPQDKLGILDGGVAFQTSNTTFNSGIGAQIYPNIIGSGNADLYFRTNQGGSGGAVRMVITNSGNVGIGTTSPSQVLTVGNNNQFTVSSGGNVAASGTLTVTGKTTLGLASTTALSVTDLYATNATIGTSTFLGNQTINGNLAVIGHTTLATASSTGLTVTGTSSLGVLTTLGTINGQTISSAASFTGSLTTVGLINAGTVLQTAATNRIDASGNLVNIGTVSTSGAINGQTISSAASFSGTLNTVGNITSTGRMGALSFKVASTYADLVNDSPWYGLGVTNLTLPGAGGVATQLAGYFGLNFQTEAGQVVLTRGGNVGIGTTAPGSLLELKSNIPVLTINGSSTAGFRGIDYQNGGTSFATSKADANSGEYRDTVGPTVAWGGFRTFYTDTVERMRITSTGNVGIGTTTPTRKLVVEGAAEIGLQLSSTGSGARIWDLAVNPSWKPGSLSLYDRTADNARLLIDTAGNVGIGTTSPNEKLDVNGGIALSANTAFVTNNALATIRKQSDNGLTLKGATGSTNDFALATVAGQIIFANPTGTNNAVFAPAAGGNVGIGTTTPTYKLDVVSGAANGIRINANTGFNNITYGTAGVDKWITYMGSTGNDFTFYDTADRVTIKSGGNVGIGTTNPNTKLKIVGSVTGAEPALLTLATNDGNSYVLQAGVNSTGYGYLQSQQGGVSYTNTPLAIQPNGGNVGIGTTSPRAKLSVANGVYNWELSPGASTTVEAINLGDVNASVDTGFYTRNGTFTFNTGGYSERMRITNGGNVGIGTTNPSEKLHVNGITLSGNASATNGAVVLAGIYNGANDYLLTLGSQRSTGGTMLGFGVKPSTSVADSYVSATSINVPRNAFTMDGAFHFLAASAQTTAQDSAVTMFERMTITNGGNVGIGTTSPSAKLDVYSTSAQDAISATGNDPSNARIAIKNLNGQNFALIAGITGLTNSGFSIRDVANSADRLVIGATGNVGIGTTDPGEKLEVAGNILSKYNSGTNAAVFKHVDASGSYLFSLNRSDGAGGNGNDLVVKSLNKIFLSTNNTDAAKMVIDNSGNVGIGTTTPLRNLDVSATFTTLGLTSSAGPTTLVMGNRDSTAIPSLIVAANGTTYIGAGTSFGSANGGTASYNLTALANGNVGIGTTNPSYKLEIATTSNSVADLALLNNLSTNSAGVRMLFNNGYGNLGAIKVSQLDNGALADDGALELQTASNAVLSTKMTILNSGNVGIGTTNPGAKLTVDPNGTSVGNNVVAQFGRNSTDAYIGFNPNGANKWFTGADTQGYVIYDITAAAERVRIGSTGNVGIGTTNPTVKLQVGVGNSGFTNSIATLNTANANTIALTLSNWTGGATAYGPRIGFDNSNYGTWYAGSSDGANNFDIARVWGTPDIRINTSGNVGIGTTNPVDKLQVNGSFSQYVTDAYTKTKRMQLTFPKSTAIDYFGIVLPEDYAGFNGGMVKVKLSWMQYHAGGSAAQEYSFAYGTFCCTTQYTAASDVTPLWRQTSPSSHYPFTTPPNAVFYNDPANNRVVVGVEGVNTLNNGGMTMMVEVELTGRTPTEPSIAYIGTTQPTGMSTMARSLTIDGTVIAGTVRSTTGLFLSGSTAGEPGGTGFHMPYVGSAPNSGPAIRWTDGALANTIGLYINAGLIYQGNAGNPDFKVFTPTGTGSFGTEVVHLGAANTSSVSWFNGGNVGIGTTTPIGKLQVAGDTYIGTAAGVGARLYLYGNGTANVTSRLYTSDGNLHIDAATGAFPIYLNYYQGTGGVVFGNGASGSNANVSAGGTYNGTAVNVAGAINSAAGPYQIGGVARLTTNGNYTTVNDASGRIGMYLGNAGDPGNYYDNATHVFRTIPGAPILTMNASNAAFTVPVTGGTYNGQTISSAANFTGTVAIADNLTFNAGRKGIIGQYDPTQTQAIFAMGAAYTLPPGGASNNYGSFYGIGWSYNPDYGGAGNNPQSKAGLNHQALFMLNGTTQSAIGTGIWTIGNVNAVTGLYTGAGAGTQRIDGSGNLTNIGTITSGLINGQTISSAANFTGTVTAGGTVLVPNLQFIGQGGNSGQPAAGSDYRIYQEPGAWTYPYPDLNIAFHTGIKIGALSGYGGTRFFNNSDMATEIFSVGNGDNNVRVVNNLLIGAGLSGRKLDVFTAANNGDGITFGQDADNSQTIQTYIDSHWSDRGSYAGGCCNALKINPDVGSVVIGSSTNPGLTPLTIFGTGSFANGIDLTGALYSRGSLLLLNKAANGWLNFANRNTAGAEAVYDLANIGTLALNGVATLNQTNLEMGRSGGLRNGISWYSPSYTAWSQYMAQAGNTNTGPHGDITAPSGSLVTTWGMRNFVENVAGYGWTFESGTATGQPSVVAEIRSSDGSAKFNGTVTSAYLGRAAHAGGFLVGSYNSVGANDAKTNPIYTIGSAYVPTDTSLSNMYGIGYSHSNFWGAGKSTGWGLYGSDNGVINFTASPSGVWTAGTITVGTGGGVIAGESGNIGIGTTTPNARLAIMGDGSNDIFNATAANTTMAVYGLNGNENGTAIGGQPGNLNAGYRFTPNVSGTISQLGAKCDAGVRSVRLYNMAGTVLASTTVTTVDVGTWSYANITPVAVSAGTSYVVAVLSSPNSYCYINPANPTMPFNVPGGYITINDSRWHNISDTMPTTNIATNIYYGIPDITFNAAVTPQLIVKASGNVGIRTPTPGQALDVVGTIRQTGATNCAVSTNSVGDLICTSDESLKNISGIYEGGLGALEKISPIRFSYKDEDYKHVGFSAQNVQSVLPEGTPMQGNGFLGLDTNAVLALVVNSAKELSFKRNTDSMTVALYEADDAVDAGTVVAFSDITHEWTDGTTSTSTATSTSTSTPVETYQLSGIRKASGTDAAIGIVTTFSTSTIQKNGGKGVPVLSSGRVAIKVTTENGEVKAGDYLTVSLTRPGYAMKLTGEGLSLGRALSNHVPGTEKVLALIENGYLKLDMAGKFATTTGMLTTGNVDLNANGVSIINIKSLASANGTWSIDEGGRIIAKTLCIDGNCLDGEGLGNIIATSKKTGEMQIVGPYGYLLNAKTHSLRVLDMSSAGNPVLLATLVLPEGVSSLAVSGSMLYVSNDDMSTMYIIDANLPSAPYITRTLDLSATSTIASSIDPTPTPAATSTPGIVAGAATSTEPVATSTEPTTASATPTATTTEPVTVTEPEPPVAVTPEAPLSTAVFDPAASGFLISPTN